ncbi:MAG TPA: glycosyltransferase family 4 protein [Isosphaeraceae bacterium]
MPKVAYLTPLYFSDESYIGGGERYPTNLAKGVSLASGGRYEVELISFGKASARVDLEPGVTLRVLSAAREPLNPLDVLSWDLPEILLGADLVHIHTAYTRCTEVGLLIAKQLRKPICVTDHGGESSRLGRYYGLVELADAIVAYSDFGGSFFRSRTPVTLVRGGVDSRVFTPSDVPVERSHILYVGRLLPHKGIDRLVRAMPDDLRLIVCGRPYRPDYFEMLRELARGKDVRFVTDADDATILDLYRRAWANVLPSVHVDCFGNYFAAPELMGFTLLEAMSCGTPAIASNLAAMPEYIRPGETGFLFDDEGELRTRLLQLAGDEALVERMGREARRTIDTEFSLEVAGAAMASLYDRLIARAAGAAA